MEPGGAVDGVAVPPAEDQWPPNKDTQVLRTYLGRGRWICHTSNGLADFSLRNQATTPLDRQARRRQGLALPFVNCLLVHPFGMAPRNTKYTAPQRHKAAHK